MGIARALSFGVAVAIAGIAAAACVDLFHSTDDVRTACEIGAAACPVDTNDGGTLCAPSADAARAEALRVCAWLGACASPTGNNAMGECFPRALLAFDCAANPNHPVDGTARAVWACLARAQDCAAVGSCIFPSGTPACASGAGPTASCGGVNVEAAESDAEAPVRVGGYRVECTPDAQPTGGENCALWGATCIADGSSASCGATGSQLGCADGGIRAACLGIPRSQIQWCGPESQDIGIDCAASGAGACEAFQPSGTSSWLACAPVPAGDASCAPSLAVACTDAGVAQSCPTGTPETIDCAALLGSPNACNAGTLDPPFDWTSPCSLASPACTADECDGSVLTACARGAAVTVDCEAEGLGACRMISTDLGMQQRPACSPP